MIHHMRHGSPPRLMAPQPIDDRALRKSHPAPSAGNRITWDRFSWKTRFLGAAPECTQGPLQPRRVHGVRQAADPWIPEVSTNTANWALGFDGLLDGAAAT